MSPTTGPCSVGDCPNEATRQTAHGPLCDAHRKRLLPSRAGGLALSAPVQKHLEPRARLDEMALALADADADDDGEYKRVRDRLARAAVAYASALISELRKTEGEERRKEARARALRAMRKGVRFGRVPKVDHHAAAHAVKEAGSIRAAARLLDVSPMAVLRALRRKGVTNSVGPLHGDLHALGGTPGSPPEEGG